MSMMVRCVRTSTKVKVVWALVMAAVLLLATALFGSVASATTPDETDGVAVTQTSESDTATPTVPSSEVEETKQSLPPEKPDTPADDADTESVDVPKQDPGGDTEQTDAPVTVQPVIPEEPQQEPAAPQQETQTSTSTATSGTTDPEELFNVSVGMSQQGYGPGTQVTAVLSGNLNPTWRLYISSVNDPGGSGAATPSSDNTYGPPLAAGQGYTLAVPVAATDTSDNSLWYVDALVLDASSNVVGSSRHVVVLPDKAPVDSDGDGVPDVDDQCPNVAGPASNNGCPIVIPLPPNPTFTDPPGPDNAEWDPQVSDDQYTWEETPDGQLIVRPTQPGHAFPGNEPSHNYGVAPDSYVPPTIIPVPPKPSVTDPEGPNNATWDKPEDGDQYTWTIEKIDGQDHLIVRPTQPNTLLTGNLEKYDYGPAEDSFTCPPGTHPVDPEGDGKVACKPDKPNPTTSPAPTTSVATTSGPSTPVTPPVDTAVPTQTNVPSNTNTVTPPVVIDDPARPGIIDPPGPGNAYWESQSDTDQFYWIQSDDKRCIAAHVRDGVTFAGGSEVDFGCAPDSEGEQAAVESSTRTGNPTPQPTGNGGEGVRISSNGGEALCLTGAGLALLALLGFMVTVRRRKGAHENA